MAVGGALLISVLPSTAEVIYSQPPNNVRLWQSSSGSYDWQATDYDTYVWDNFTLAANTAIAGVAWHGIYDYGGWTPYYKNPVTDFVISIYPSKILGPTYSEPDLRFDSNGTPHPLMSFKVRSNAHDFPICDVPCYNTWHTYSASLPAPFQAKGGTEYWLQIEGIQKGMADWSLSTGSGGNGRSFATSGYRFVGLGNDAGFELSSARAIDNENPLIQYQGWKGYRNASADGGTYRMSAVRNDTLSFVFSGKSLDWVTRLGPDMGIAHVSIDGIPRPDVDLYSEAPVYQSIQSYRGLTTGNHTLTIQVAGIRNVKSTANKVALDAVVVGTTRTQDSSYKISYGKWGGKVSPNANGGNYRWVETPNATAQLTFKGTQVDWVTTGGPAYGVAEVFIDGANQGMIDLYRPSVQWKLPISFAGLSAGNHTIKVKALGQKNVLSTGTTVIVDSFSVF